MAGGRPTKYNQLWEKHQSKLAKLYSAGLTDKEIAALLEITEQTINNWKIKHPEFFEALNNWKNIADGKVERSLYERAIGYSHPDVHISNYQGNITVTDITKHYPPDPTSMIFWLKNRQPERWKDKAEMTLPTDIDSITIGFKRGEKE